MQEHETQSTQRKILDVRKLKKIYLCALCVSTIARLCLLSRSTTYIHVSVLHCSNYGRPALICGQGIVFVFLDHISIRHHNSGF